MQKFIRIFGLFLFILSLGACVKEEITTFEENIFKNWRLQEEKIYFYNSEIELDTLIFTGEFAEDTLITIDFGNDDSVTVFDSYLFIDQNGELRYDTLEFSRFQWEEKGDEELLIGNDIFEIYYLVNDELILRKYTLDSDNNQYPYRIEHRTYSPFTEINLMALDTIEVF